MRNVYRGLIAGAFGLPLMLGAPSVALADGDDKGDENGGHHQSGDRHGKPSRDDGGDKAGDSGNKAGDWSRPSSEQLQGQKNTAGQEQTNEQTNNNRFLVYQFVFGGSGDPMQMVTPTLEQENESKTEQNQGFVQGQMAEQGQDVEQNAANSNDSSGSGDSENGGDSGKM